MKLSLIVCAASALIACSSGVMQAIDAGSMDATTEDVVDAGSHDALSDGAKIDASADAEGGAGDAGVLDDASVDASSDAPDGDGYSPPCIPTVTLDGGPVRAALNNLASSTTTGCASGNPCQENAYHFTSTYEQNFADAGEQIVCSGVSTCVANVGIDTFNGSTICQGTWDVYCDSAMVGTIDTLTAGSCIGSPMTNKCSVSFPPVTCSTITLVAETGSGSVCCGKGNVDSMIVAVSAW